MQKIRIGNDIRLAVELRQYISGNKVQERQVYNPGDSNFEGLDNNPFVNWNEVYLGQEQEGESTDVNAGTSSVCIRSVKAILINETLKEKREKDLKNKSRFVSRFPMEPLTRAFASSPYNIHNSGYPSWKAYPKNHMFATYHGFGVNPDWDSIYRNAPMRNDIEYLANAAATDKQSVVEVMFPAEHQLHTGVYSLIIVAKVYAPGFNSHNLKTYTIDVPNVFELVSTSAEGIDSDMYVDVTALMDKLPEDVVYTPDVTDVFVRQGWASTEGGDDILNLNRTDDSTVQVNLNSITGWYNEED